MSQNKELGVCIFFNSKNKNKLTATVQFFFKMTHLHYANNYIYIQYTITHNFTIYDGTLNMHATDNTAEMCHLNINATS